MYKIMIADDEGIAVQGLKFIIEKNFGERCAVECAKTGREVIELSETFRPDIIFMDIQMPGINGIDAIREIKKTQPEIKFIILTAYDKFSYAKTAIELGVLKYMNKPIDQKQIVHVIEEAMKGIDARRVARSEDLKIREKFETAIPMLESGFVYDMLFKTGDHSELEALKNLLGLNMEYGFVAIFEFKENTVKNATTNVTGTSVIIQKDYSDIKDSILSDVPDAIVSNPLVNKIILFIPDKLSGHDYNRRLNIVENARSMANALSKKFDLDVRIGIGSVKDIPNMKESYREAVNVLKLTDRKVAHADDVSVNVGYEDDYPIVIEKQMFNHVEVGNFEGSMFEAEGFYDWMYNKSNGSDSDIRLKVIEFVLHAERIAYETAGMKYVFKSRTDYLTSVNELSLDHELKQWFIDKIGQAAKKVANTKKDKKRNVINKAIKYINENYSNNISLDDVSMEIDVTPTYFSRLFKEEMEINFVEYVNKLRIEKAKELLLGNDSKSMKEICIEVGYSDPNYFSRQFRKYEGISPTEYIEGISER